MKKGLPLEKVKEAAYEAARKAGAAEEKAREIGDKAAIAAAESKVGVVDNVSHFDSEKEDVLRQHPAFEQKPSVDGIEMGKMKIETKESKVDETKKESTKETKKDDVPPKKRGTKQDD